MTFEYRPPAPMPPPAQPLQSMRPQKVTDPILYWARVSLVAAVSFLALEVSGLIVIWLRTRPGLEEIATGLVTAVAVAMILGAIFSLAGTAYLSFYTEAKRQLKDIPIRERQVETVQVQETLPAGERIELMGFHALVDHYLKGQPATRREMTDKGQRWTQGEYSKVHQLMVAAGIRTDRKWVAVEDFKGAYALLTLWSEVWVDQDGKTAWVHDGTSRKRIELDQ